MIISKNYLAHNEDFQLLLNSTLKVLNEEALNSKENYTLFAGKKLEDYVYAIMKKQSIGTSFENTIILESGQRFPDIVAKKYFGIEVKSTTQNHWKTTGNSVLESTRIQNVERIYMLFGKLASPVEFRCRPYEDCLSEVVVTHSPRYLIDMNLPEGMTIFDKMKLSYDNLRSQSNPIKPVVEYYKSKLKPGEDIWWINQEENSTNNFIIKIWNNLSRSEQQHIIVQAFTYFPELLGSSQDKFSRVAIWLIKDKGIVCPNVRDIFTAGGREEVYINNEIIKVPKIIYNLIIRKEEILKEIQQTPLEILNQYWKISTTKKNRITDWLTLVKNQIRQNRKTKDIDISNF